MDLSSARSDAVRCSDSLAIEATAPSKRALIAVQSRCSTADEPVRVTRARGALGRVDHLERRERREDLVLLAPLRHSLLGAQPRIGLEPADLIGQCLQVEGRHTPRGAAHARRAPARLQRVRAPSHRSLFRPASALASAFCRARGVPELRPRRAAARDRISRRTRGQARPRALTRQPDVCDGCGPAGGLPPPEGRATQRQGRRHQPVLAAHVRDRTLSPARASQPTKLSSRCGTSQGAQEDGDRKELRGHPQEVRHRRRRRRRRLGRRRDARAVRRGQAAHLRLRQGGAHHACLGGGCS